MLNMNCSPFIAGEDPHPDLAAMEAVETEVAAAVVVAGGGIVIGTIHVEQSTQLD